MNCDTAFKKRILLECYDALESYGFYRYRKTGIDYSINDDFSCWVGLNSALYPDRVELVPNVGLHVAPIEEMICALDKGEFATRYDRSVATYSINIGELEALGGERAFAFSPKQSDSFITAECSRLASLYATEGIKYAKSIANYELLAPLLSKKVNTLGGNPERYASCLYLMGRIKDAHDFLLFFPDQYKEYIKGFSIPFLAKLETELVS